MANRPPPPGQQRPPGPPGQRPPGPPGQQRPPGPTGQQRPPGPPGQMPPGPPGQGPPPAGRGPVPPAPQSTDPGRARGRPAPSGAPPAARPPPPAAASGPPGSGRPGPPMPSPAPPGSRPPPPSATAPGSRPPPPTSQRPGPPGPKGAQPTPPASTSGDQASGDPTLGLGRGAYRADHRTEATTTRTEGGQGSASSSTAAAGSSIKTGGGVSSPAASEALSPPPTSGIAVSATGRGAERGGGVDRGGSRGVRTRPDFIVKTRPESLVDKKGTTAHPINLLTNYFRLELKTGWKLMQYRVDYAPEIDETKLKKHLFRQHQKVLGNYIFDGTMLFTPAVIVQKDQTRELVSKREDDGTFVKITIRYAGQCTPIDFHYIQFFNILLRTVMEGLELQQLGRDYYDPNAKILLPTYKLELWPGYVTSIRQHESNVLLCCEISNKILRTDTVHVQLGTMSKKFGSSFQTQAQKELLGCIVLTRYNNKTYKIDDIDFSLSPSSTFTRKNGQPISYIDYYMERYKIQIRDLKQPMLISQPKMADIRRGFNTVVILIPELCHMTGLTDEQRADFRLMKDLGEYTRTVPEKRIETLLKFANRLHGTKAVQEEFGRWAIAYTPQLEKFAGHVLQPEKILKQPNPQLPAGAQQPHCVYKLENADWGSEFRNFKLFNSTPCQKWIVIFTQREENEVNEFLPILGQVSKSMGFDLGAPKRQLIPDNRNAKYIEELNKACELKPQMIMAVVPNNRPGGPYDAIKKVLCVDRPVPSQVMTHTVLKKFVGKMNGVAQKVAIQMAAKIGSEPWGLEIPLKDLMIIGYDSYHDTAQKGMSVGAVVSSTNRSLTRFASSCTFHKNNEELLNQLKTCVAKGIRRYNEENRCMPGKIIVYRDGVGDGDLDYVRGVEIVAIKQIFKDNNFEPKFTYIVVSKRINSRFFKVEGGRYGNPPSGTVIDDVVTLPERYDFFLVSQSVRQGTVNPTSYNVIEDTSNLKPDHIQKLTYKLTHLYYNWPGTVRVPMVCQYAHKLAFLVGNSLHRKPSEALENLLYYL